MNKRKKVILIIIAVVVVLILFYPVLKFNVDYYKNTWGDVFSSIQSNIADLFDKIKGSKYAGPKNISGQRIVQEESVIIDVANRVSPAVVSIVEKTTYIDFFSGVATSAESGIGTGFIVDTNGLVMTNAHVVDNSNAQYSVVLSDGTVYQVNKVHLDASNDVAILEITARNLPVVEFGDSDSLQIGQTAIAIGNALGRFSNTVTVGVISGKARQVQASSPSGGQSKVYDDVIQTDAALNPGNSGGPLLNSSGQVIGINVATTLGAENVGFAIPIDDVKPLLAAFIKEGKIVQAFLGVSHTLITKELAQLRNMPIGAYITSVVQGSPADKSGLKRGDIIKSVDGVAINSQNSLSSTIVRHNVGDRVKLVIDRNGTEMVLYAVLAAAPGNS